MRFPWSRRKNDAFTRNRAFLHSPVTACLDALFADPDRNASIYTSLLADPPERLSPEYLRSVLERHSPDPVKGVASTDEVITHLFDHILGPRSWWGGVAPQWHGEELLAAGYRDAVARAQAAGNVPIRTFQMQASSDAGFQVQVLDAGRVIVVVIALPPLPNGPGPVSYKLTGRNSPVFPPMDKHMPSISSYTIETLPHR